MPYDKESDPTQTHSIPINFISPAATVNTWRGSSSTRTTSTIRPTSSDHSSYQRILKRQDNITISSSTTSTGEFLDLIFLRGNFVGSTLSPNSRADGSNLLSSYHYTYSYLMLYQY